jgi:predicted chitinase
MAQFSEECNAGHEMQEDMNCSALRLLQVFPSHFNHEQACSISRKKSCGQPLGEGWPRAIRSGTGRGGDVTGSRNS